MRIELLRKRERFEEIFADSLNIHLRNRFNWKGSVQWTTNRSSAFASNDYLNVIFPKDLAGKKVRTLTQEYAYQPSVLKRILQSAYVNGATSPFLRPFTCPRGLNISPMPQQLEQSVFLPGNHSHRIIDFSSDRSIVFQKKGFNSDFLKAEISIRQSQPKLIAPKLLEVQSTQGWYEEERVAGLPHNRIPSERLKADSLLQAQQNLSLLYRNTEEQRDMREYQDTLVDELESLTHRIAPTLKSQTLRKGLFECVAIMGEQGKLVTPALLRCCMTHGDFQAANLLMSGGQATLIDWEYSQLRSYHYDALVWELGIRFPKVFESKIHSFIESLRNGNSALGWTGHSFNCDDMPAIWVFLMEDLHLKLREVASPRIESKDQTLFDYSSALLKAIKTLAA